MTWPTYSRECRKEIGEILRKGKSLTAYRANMSWGSVGPRKGSQAFQLERDIERKFKVKHAIATNSGTAALHAGLEAIGVRDKEVVTSPYTFSATAGAILMAGGRPVFADVDPHTFTITAATVKPVLTRRTAAIVPVHLFGYLPEMEALKDFEIPILEDACQAVGASRQGHYSGTQGSAGVYSYNGGKQCPAGEGGTLVTNDDAIAEKARLLVNHGENFGAKEVGVNYRCHELVACLARRGLMELEMRNRRRVALSLGTFRYLGLGRSTYFLRHFYVGQRPHVFYVTPFTVEKNRPRFIARCAKRGLPIQAGYTTPLHRLPAFKQYQTAPLPVVEELHDKTLCLLTTLTPDRPISYSRWVAKVIRESLA